MAQKHANWTKHNVKLKDNSCTWFVCNSLNQSFPKHDQMQCSTQKHDQLWQYDIEHEEFLKQS